MRLLCVLCVLAGCGVTDQMFRGVPATQVDVAGSTFEVRVRGNLAEAIRINPEYAPRFGPIRARAGFAMEMVSGCRVTGVLGDQAVATGLLDCGDGRSPLLVGVPVSYSCLDIAQWSSTASGTSYVEFDYDPVF